MKKDEGDKYVLPRHDATVGEAAVPQPVDQNPAPEAAAHGEPVVATAVVEPVPSTPVPDTPAQDTVPLAGGCCATQEA